MGGAAFRSPMVRATAVSIRDSAGGEVVITGSGVKNLAFEGENAEVTVLGGKVGVGELADGHGLLS